MKYFFIAGEQSGDFHGSTLMHELKIIDDKYKFVFFGGDLMRAEAGVRPIRHIREMSFMGFWVVFKNMFKILDNLKVCKAAILKEKPDAVVLIDYPGFNLYEGARDYNLMSKYQNKEISLNELIKALNI